MSAGTPSRQHGRLAPRRILFFFSWRIIGLDEDRVPNSRARLITAFSAQSSVGFDVGHGNPVETTDSQRTTASSGSTVRTPGATEAWPHGRRSVAFSRDADAGVCTEGHGVQLSFELPEEKEMQKEDRRDASVWSGTSRDEVSPSQGHPRAPHAGKLQEKKTRAPTPPSNATEEEAPSRPDLGLPRNAAWASAGESEVAPLARLRPNICARVAQPDQCTRASEMRFCALPFPAVCSGPDICPGTKSRTTEPSRRIIISTRGFRHIHRSIRCILPQSTPHIILEYEFPQTRRNGSP